MPKKDYSEQVNESIMVLVPGNYSRSIIIFFLLKYGLLVCSGLSVLNKNTFFILSVPGNVKDDLCSVLVHDMQNM